MKSKKNILILGASGFIGKNLLIYFLKKKNIMFLVHILQISLK